MANEWHVSWLKEGVANWNYRRKRVKFAPDLSGIRFFDLLPPDFRDAPKTSRFFERIDLSGSDLIGADLSDLNFARAKFDGANMTEANLSLSNFSSASFRGSKLLGARANSSLFDEARFEDADLTGVDFSSSSARGAVFIAVELTSVQSERLAVNLNSVFTSRAAYRAALSERSASYSSEKQSGQFKEDKRTAKNKYDVFFGTNRQPIYERGVLSDFSGEHDDELRFGVCEVIVPEGHRVGSLGSSIFRRLLNLQDDRLRMSHVISLNEELFFEFVRTGANKMKIKQKPTIFVHGYNNTFENAVLRAAQIGYDLGIGQGVGLFSWPSKGEFLRYKTDEAAVEASKYFLADFIEKFVTSGVGQGVNLVAHSMGCRCLLGALEVLSIDRKSVLGAVDQVILAAADVDTALMPNLGKPAVLGATRATSYISDRDKALKLSGWLHSFPRVGITPPTFVMSGLDTVLVNNLDLGDAQHGYVGTSRAVLGDIFDLLKKGTPPDDRFTIESINWGGVSYWRLKE